MSTLEKNQYKTQILYHFNQLQGENLTMLFGKFSQTNPI